MRLDFHAMRALAFKAEGHRRKGRLKETQKMQVEECTSVGLSMEDALC